MPQKIIALPDGRVVEFPDTMDDDAISRALGGGGARTPAQAGLPDPTMQAQHALLGIIEGGPEARQQTQEAKFAATLQAEGGIKASPIGPPVSAGLRTMAAVAGGERFLRGKAEGAETLPALEGAAESALGIYGGGKLLSLIGRAIPSAARAGRTLQTVKEKAGSVPIDVNTAGSTALEIQRLAESGGAMPKVVRDFLRRSTDPTKGDITFAEARDFYSNASRLSANETQRLTPVMHRQLAKFTHELRTATEQAAETVGQGGAFKQGMGEYRKASQLRTLGKKVTTDTGKSLRQGIGFGLGTGVAYGLYRKITGQ